MSERGRNHMALGRQHVWEECDDDSSNNGHWQCFAIDDHRKEHLKVEDPCRYRVQIDLQGTVRGKLRIPEW